MSSVHEKIPVVILAGRPEKRDALMEHAGVDNKVLITYRGETILENCVRAVMPFAEFILFVGIKREQVSLPEGCPETDFIEMEGEQYDKIYAGIKYMDNWMRERGVSGRHVLYMSGDLPLLREDVVQRFLHGTGDKSQDFYYSIVPEQVFLEKAPDLEWGYMKIRDGKFASGNLILIDPSKIVDKYDMIKFLSTNRKSFIIGVLKASPWIFLKLLFGRVRLRDAEELMTKMFGIESRLVVSEDYELAFDLDLPEHLDWLRSKERR